MGSTSQGMGDMPDPRTHPLVPPPLGTEPNFVNPESRAPMTIAIASIMLSLAVFSMAGRLYARKFILNQIGWDDWVGLAGCAFTAEYTIYSCVLFSLPGFGPHIWNIPGIVFMDEKYGLRLLFTEIMYCPSAYLVKLSIFMLYWRLFVTGVGRVRYFILGGICVSSILYLVLMIMSFAFCTKSTSVVDNGECHRKGAYVTWALAVVNLTTDIYLLSIPPFVIKKLRVSTQRKWSVSIVFLFSLAATTASIVSVYYRVYVSRHSEDFSWTIMPAAIATICELNLGVICSSLPAMNIFFHRARHQSRANTGYKTPTHNSTWPLNSMMRSQRAGNANSAHGRAEINNSIGGDRDIVKLIDIEQYSVAVRADNPSLDGTSNFSGPPSLHRG